MTQPPKTSGNTRPRRSGGRSARTDSSDELPATAAAPGAGESMPAELELLVTTLPRRTSHLSRVLFRTRGSSLPRGMRSVVFTLAFGPMRISEIAWEEGVGQPAATRMVARLEALGLVTRARSETDKRIVMVALTERGLGELDTLREQSRGLLRDALRDRSEAELRRLRGASESLALLTDWVLEQERAVYGGAKRPGLGRKPAAAKRSQSTSAAASRRKTRRALPS